MENSIFDLSHKKCELKTPKDVVPTLMPRVVCMKQAEVEWPQKDNPAQNNFSFM